MTYIEDIQYMIDLLSIRLRRGCGNHGCRIKEPFCLGTNAICRCTPDRLAKDLLDIAIMAEQCGKTFERKPRPEIPYWPAEGSPEWHEIRAKLAEATRVTETINTPIPEDEDILRGDVP